MTKEEADVQLTAENNLEKIDSLRVDREAKIAAEENEEDSFGSQDAHRHSHHPCPALRSQAMFVLGLFALFGSIHHPK